MNYLSTKLQLPRISAFLLGLMSPVFMTLPVLGAERISFSYSLFEISVPIASLETYAKEGKIDQELAGFAGYLKPEDLQEIRQRLNQRLELSPTTLSQFFYSSMGETSLSYLGESLQTEAHQNGFYAIRAALILAAADPEGLTALNALKKFPSSTLRVNAKVVLPIITAFNQLSSLTEQVDRAIAQQATLEANHTPLNLPTTNLQEPGVWIPQKQTLNLHDRHRRRSILVDLYYPLLPNAPVLVLSHGLGSSRMRFADLAQHLASHGFVVAALDHAGSDRQHMQSFLNGATKDAITAREFIDRPLDVSYMLDALEQLNNADALGQIRLNLNQVGILGHSLGGYTGFALAGAEINVSQLTTKCQSNDIHANTANVSMLLQCLVTNLSPRTIPRLHDQRIQAVFAFNPIGSSIFGQQGFGQVQVPVMIVGGSRDLITPALLEQVCPFSWLKNSEKYLALIQGGTHVYSNQSNGLLRPIGESNQNLELSRSYLKAMSLAFAKAYVEKQTEYKLYLTAFYAQSISQSTLPLNLVQTFNSEQVFQTLNFQCLGSQEAQK
jgi:predicted dienelactone hydrolase